MKRMLLVLGASLLMACGGGDDDGSGGGSAHQDVLDAIPNADSANGGAIYSSLCGTSACHGANGNDGSVSAGDLTVIVPSISDADFAAVIQDGIGSMPAQKQLSAQETADAIVYSQETF
jgi:mono/diheme cytochrome c family protein